jgi:outer membrane protein assembly factor BamB
VHYGINVFMFGTDTERVLALTDIGGFRWVRQQIHWRDLEGEQGQFVWKPLDQIVSAARARDMQLLLSVVRSPPWATADGNTGLPDDPAAMADFMRTVATRYRGRVAAYQVWNEPNLAHEGGGAPVPPEDYLALLEAVYPAIKEGDPCALVVSAAMASTNRPDPAVASEDLPYFDTLYTLNNGAFLRAADVVALHPGAGTNPPAARWSADEPEQSHQYFRHVERVREIMQRYGDQRPVWITEYGWTVTRAEGAPQPVSEQQQANYLADALWYARHHYPWIRGMFVWNLNFSVIAPPSDEKTTFSILGPDWSVRPSFLMLQNNVPALRDLERVPLVPATATHTYNWTFPGRGQMRTTPLLAPDGTIYIVSHPGTLYTVGPDGRFQWQYNAAGVVSAPPALAADGTIYIADSGSLLTALQPDGAMLWQVRLDSPARGSPIVLGDRVAVVSNQGIVYAFDNQGRELWTQALDGESTPPARLSDDTLLVVSATGVATLLDRDGQIQWSTRLGGEFWAAPVADEEGGAYIVTVAGGVLALDSSGELRWNTSVEAPVIAEPLLGNDGRLYIAARDGTLSALDTSSGGLIWRTETGSSDLVAPPAQDDSGRLYLGTDDERLLVLDETGEQRWQVQMRGTVHAQPTIGSSGALYVPTTSGRLYGFEQR